SPLSKRQKYQQYYALVGTPSGVTVDFAGLRSEGACGRNSKNTPPTKKMAPATTSPAANEAAAATPPRIIGAKAEMPRPTLNVKPAPVARTRVGYSSPR